MHFGQLLLHFSWVFLLVGSYDCCSLDHCAIIKRNNGNVSCIFTRIISFHFLSESFGQLSLLVHDCGKWCSICGETREVAVLGSRESTEDLLTHKGNFFVGKLFLQCL